MEHQRNSRKATARRAMLVVAFRAACRVVRCAPPREVARAAARVRRLDGDQRGSITIVSVFAAMLLTMLLGMVMNVGRQVDGKIRMQNAADASAYSGGLVLARGMNTLAFTNHLLFDVFAMTAFMREAQEGNAASYVPEILEAWNQIGPVFQQAPFPKFQRLGGAIIEKVPREQRLTDAFSAWAAAASAQILPLLEEILAQEMIPQFQRAVVVATPDMAQAASREVARLHGNPQRGRGPMLGVLWRTWGVPVGGASDTALRTLPVVDPVWDYGTVPGDHLSTAIEQREEHSHRYLGIWNNRAMSFFDRYAKMSQFGVLWRGFTCGQLKKLLEVEYPSSNLPMVIRAEEEDIADSTTHLQQHFSFLGVTYWQELPGMMPRLFRDPSSGDALAYAEVRMFIPQRRLVWRNVTPDGGGGISIGGIPGDFPDLDDDSDDPGDPPDEVTSRWIVGRDPHVSEQWNLLNQNWTVQLVPATQPSLATILQTAPPVPEFGGGGLELPDLGGLGSEDIMRISPH
jgi:hypothetical protein